MDSTQLEPRGLRTVLEAAGVSGMRSDCLMVIEFLSDNEDVLELDRVDGFTTL